MRFSQFNNVFLTEEGSILLSIPSYMIFEDNGQTYVVKGKIRDRKNIDTKKSSKITNNFQDVQDFDHQQQQYYKGLRLVDGNIYNLVIKAVEDYNVTSFEIRSLKKQTRDPGLENEEMIGSDIEPRAISSEELVEMVDKISSSIGVDQLVDEIRRIEEIQNSD